MKNKFHALKKIFERTKHETPIVPLMHKSGRVHGFTHKGNEFIHHSNLHHTDMAFQTVVWNQKIMFAILGALFVLALIANWHITLIILFSTLTVVYFLDLLFNAFLIIRTFSVHPELVITDTELASIDDATLPIYTIFCPLYKEWHVVPQFVEAMHKLDYPKNKLQILFLLEEDDQETVEKVRAANLPEHFEVVVVPHSKPKTKPKAMNYGLQFTKGTFIVVYDAEDVPDPDQLKKALIAFNRVGPEVICVQAKLNFYNPRQNILTRVFTAEYSLWFDLVLPGFQSIFAPIPLGGTSNHFKTEALRNLSGWDAFNVTEDCDLGMRISKQGFRTAIIDSTTLEEANSNVRNWYNQRSRWIKGYIQTYLVHMRKPRQVIRDGQARDLLIFQFIVGGKVLSLFINPLMWVITLCYFMFRAQIGLFIESLFPGPILFIGVFSLLFGNFLYLYYYMIGCAKRGYNDLIKFVFLVPLYWLGMSVAAWRAVYEVIVKPHYWAKTRHGLHLEGATYTEQNKTEKNTHAESKKDLSLVKSGASMLIVASLVSNFLNFVFNAYIGRQLPLGDFGTISIISTIAYILALFVGALSTTTTHVVSHLEGTLLGKGGAFFKKYILRLLIPSMLGTTLWILAVPFVATFLNVSNTLLLFLFAPAILLGVFGAFNDGYIKGTWNFAILATIYVFEASTKLMFVILFVSLGHAEYAPLAIPLSIMCASIATTVGAIFVYKKTKLISDAQKKSEKFPFLFYFAAFLNGVSVTAFLSLDVILAKHYLSPEAAGLYGMLSLVGKMIFLFGSLFNTFIVTLVGRAEGQHKNPQKEFGKIFLATAFLTISASLGLVILGPIIVPLFLGSKAILILEYVRNYSIAMALFTLSMTITLYRLARKEYIFSILSLLMSLVLFRGIYYAHDSIANFVGVVLWTNVIFFILFVFFHYFHTIFIYIYRNLRDLLTVFKKIPNTSEPSAGNMKILIFNWRDLDNVFAGGAEIYIQTMASHWVKEGHAVTLFCSNDGTQKQNEFVDGVRIIRRGGFFGLYIAAAVYYLFKFRGKFDVIIDCENGIPFFTPLYAKEPIYCLVHHIHQEVFRKSLIWPLSSIACILEKNVMPHVYKHSKFITVSNSSKKDLERLKITDKEISVVHPGIDVNTLSASTKSLTPLITYIGRLKEYKSIDILIKAFAKVIQTNPDARLVIAGDGDSRSSLLRLTAELKLLPYISFPGRISEAEKINLLQKSWVFVNPSFMEGWGITTIEASACGTPVVASDVPGLRDSVRDGETGILVPYGKTNMFAEKIVLILKDHELLKQLSENAVRWAAHFGWEKSGRLFLSIIKS